MSKSAAIATWVGIVSAIAGGFFGLRAYQMDVDKTVDQRVQNAFDLVREFNSKDMQQVRQPVLDYVSSKMACKPNMQIQEVTSTNIFAFIEFFDLVQSCVDADLCDQATAETFFSPYANGHWPVLREYVEQVRAAEASMMLERPFGFGFEALAVQPIDAPACVATR